MTSREEVAKQLRVYATDFDFGDSNPIWYVEKAVFNDIRIREQGRVFFRLADLIDPTCEVVGVPDNDEFMVRVVSGFMCKKCRHEAIVERSCNGWAEPPKYCPHCGARVVCDE